VINADGRALAVFVRWPEPGQVLPGIARRLGAEGSAQVYEAFIGDIIAGLPLAPCSAALWALDNLEGFRGSFPGIDVRLQEGRTEGKRLHACFEELLSRNTQAVVIGSSLPDLHPRLLRAAFEMLDRRDAVVGPTERGGFYLLGMREPRNVFRGVQWGAPDVLATLLRNLEKAHLDYGFFPTRQKIETYEDLVLLSRRLHRPVAPLTYSTLQTLGIGRDAKEVV
jgi:glycosyltransferase A (GT-A) superfamily protein (DUF2064 family)